MATGLSAAKECDAATQPKRAAQAAVRSFVRMTFSLILVSETIHPKEA
jgi:hypothetical protein